MKSIENKNHVKRKGFIIIFLVTSIVCFIGLSMVNVQQAKNREGILHSPNKSKSVEFIRTIETSQLMMNFHKTFFVGGGNITSGNFEANDMQDSWKDENTLVIEFPKHIKFHNRETQVQFFDEIVEIKNKAKKRITEI